MERLYFPFSRKEFLMFETVLDRIAEKRNGSLDSSFTRAFCTHYHFVFGPQRQEPSGYGVQEILLQVPPKTQEGRVLFGWVKLELPKKQSETTVNL